MNPNDVVSLSEGEIRFWLVDGTLHLKCATKEGDPVELNLHELQELLDSLTAAMQHMD